MKFDLITSLDNSYDSFLEAWILWKQAISSSISKPKRLQQALRDVVSSDPGIWLYSFYDGVVNFVTSNRGWIFNCFSMPGILFSAKHQKEVGDSMDIPHILVEANVCWIEHL